MLRVRFSFAALAIATLCAGNAPSAICMDPAPDQARPASLSDVAVPSYGETLLGVMYTAAGSGDHPTVVLLHGFPGYEQNLDLAQAIRRAGWNVLALHYRGSWGVGGEFSIAHTIEDADAMVAFVRSPENATRLHVDRDRIVVVGHSLGGFVAAIATAHEPAVLGAVMIGTWDVTASVRGSAGVPRATLLARVEKAEAPEAADFAPLRGYDARKMLAEIVDHRDAWDLNDLAPHIAPRPVLLLTADDDSEPVSARFEQALEMAGDTRGARTHAATDHAWSGRRLYLQTLVLDWLSSVASRTTIHR